MSVTASTIKDLITRYVAFARNPSVLDGKLVTGIARAAQQLGGSWAFDDEDEPVVSCFEGITLICWRFSDPQPVDAAAQYEDLVLQNYNVWAQMTTGAARDRFRAECHSRTDTLPDWTSITKEVAPRTSIIQQAINVTSGMYGDSAPETVASEKLWDSRL